MPDDEPSNPIPGLEQLDYDAAVASVNGAEKPALSPEDRAAHPMAAERYEFKISLVEGSGKVVEGSFTNKILNDDERLKIGLLASTFVRRTPWALLDPDTQYAAQVAAHLALSLVSRPEWYKPGLGLNPRVTEKVYAEVTKHETFFRGSDGP